MGKKWNSISLVFTAFLMAAGFVFIFSPEPSS